MQKTRKIKRNRLKSKRGFTLPELLISIVLLLPVFTVVMQTFIKCTTLTDIARNSSIAVWTCKNQIAAIQNTAFVNIAGTWNNDTFTAANANVNGIGVTYIDSSDPDHVVVTVSFSWRERSGRIIGEDADLDGTLDVGEDANGNGQLDSEVEMTTVIYNIT